MTIIKSHVVYCVPGMTPRKPNCIEVPKKEVKDFLFRDRHNYNVCLDEAVCRGTNIFDSGQCL
jgi:hypothetical protein